METSTLQLPKELIEGIVQTQVSAAVSAALVDKDSLLRVAVTKVLTQKVDQNGKPSSYSSATQYVDWLMNDMLKKVVQRTLEAEFSKHEKLIKEQIASQLSKKNSPLLKQLVNGLTTGVINASKQSYNLTVNVEARNG